MIGRWVKGRTLWLEAGVEWWYGSGRKLEYWLAGRGSAEQGATVEVGCRATWWTCDRVTSCCWHRVYSWEARGMRSRGIERDEEHVFQR